MGIYAIRVFLFFSYVLDLHYDFHYRDQIPLNAWDKKKNLIADISMGVVLAFVMYKAYSEPEHLLVRIVYFSFNLLKIFYPKCTFFREILNTLIIHYGQMKN